MDPSISVKNISKLYRVGLGLTNLRELFGNSGLSRSKRFHWAVDDVSFSILPGEALGIIGPNGAGKTTILKILSNVTHPSQGEVHVNGRLSALIELGAGFHPDLTGRENVFLNGIILGMRRSEIASRFDEIVQFAGIGDYLDTPVKRYSSGMYARLGFAIAAHVDPDVLLVDEVLAVGDYAFQQKCYARMEDLRSNGTSLILVSHNLEAVRRVCDRGLVMYGGQAVFQGSTNDSVVAYSDAIRNAARQSNTPVPLEGGLSQRVMTFDAEIECVELLDHNGNSVTALQSCSNATVVIKTRFIKDVSHPIFSFYIRTPDGYMVYNTTTRWMNIQTPNFSAGDRCQVKFMINLPLLDGQYELGADIASPNLSHYYDRMERAMMFWVQNSNGAKGIVDLETKVLFCSG